MNPEEFGMTSEEFTFYAADAHRAGWLRRRLFGGYKVSAVKGRVHLRDAIQRYDDLRAEMSKQIDKWEAGAMTKAEKRQALVELVVLAWKKDREGEEEAVASLRDQGIETRELLEGSGIDPEGNRVWRQDEEQS